MKVAMFSSWQVRCGIADYAAALVAGLRTLPDTDVDVVGFDREAHPRADYARWGQALNSGQIAHIQHEYSFFGYLLPWRNHFGALAGQVKRPLVITRHVSFDGPLTVPAGGVGGLVRKAKWSMYNRWLGPYARHLNKDTFDIAQRIIVLSGRLKDHLVARGVEAAKIRVIPGGAPDVPPARGGEAVRARYGWEGRRVIGQFGYIAPPKGHALALDALARLPADYVLLIAGGPRLERHRPFQEAIEAHIAALGLGERVRITGYLAAEDIPAHIDACDALIYPYTHADFSYSVATGLAYRHAPVVASDIYGHREIAAACAGMTLFASGDAEALAASVRRVVETPTLREAAREGMQRYAVTHAWPAIAARTREVYAEIE